MKTPILNTAIAVIVASTVLGVTVLPRTKKKPTPIVNPLQWAMAQHLRTPPKPGELEAYQENAKRELGLLDEVGKAVERMEDSDAKRNFQEQSPAWRAKIERVAKGDLSDRAAFDISGATGQWERAWEKLVGGGPKQSAVTLHNYFQIHDGMTFWEVDRILGYGAVEQSSAGNLKTYAWRDGASCIVVSFQDDKLIAKTKAGL